MRLTCPNCGARYEVDDSMLPPEGRDVQCSNCSTTWFQPGRRTDRQPDVQDTPPEPEEVAPQPEDPGSEAEPDEAAPEPQAGTAEDDQPEPADDDAAPEQTGPRQAIDPAVRDILREEAARETRLRDAEPVETQGEMLLPEEPDAAHRARRMAELEAAEDAFEFDPDDPGAAGSRRDLLPDIEEINSTLRATGERSGTEVTATDIETLDIAPRRRRGVRIGFLFVLALAAGGAAVYANADRVAELMPAAEATVVRFVEGVDNARFWLDDMARGLAGDDAG